MKKVTFAKYLGIIFLLCSVFILGVSLVIGPSISTLTGVIILVVSIMYLMNPAVTYDDEKIELKNLWGMTLKTYRFNTDTFAVRDQKITINGKKLRLSSAMLVASEYNAFVDHVRGKISNDTDPALDNATDGRTEKAMSDNDILDEGL